MINNEIIKQRADKLLFRQEAIDHSTNKLSGDVLLLPKVSYILLMALVFLWVVLLMVWLTTSHYSRKETVTGWLEPSEGVVKIYNPLVGGIIAKIFVAEGEAVVKGMPLVILRNSKNLSQGGELSELLTTELSNQRSLLVEQVERNKKDHPIRQQYLIDQLTSARSELDQFRQQLKTIEEHESLAQSETEKFQRLFDQRMVSQLELNKANKELLSIRGNKLSLLRALKQQESLIEKLNKEISLFPTKDKNTLAELNGRLNEIDQRLLQVKSRNEVVINAPISGTVDSIQASRGQILPSTTPILSIVPQDSNLKVNLLVPVRAVGFIEVGQPLDIRYDAFPYQKFGTYKANITKVAETILLPNEILNLPTALKEAVYKVEANLDKETISAYGREVKLKSGMTLYANIYLSERTLIEWLLEPFYSLKGRFQ